MEEELGFSPALYQPGFLSLMLEGLGEGLIACDPEGGLLCANRFAREIFGVELTGRGDISQGLRRLIASGAAEFPLARALRGESFRELDYWYRSADRLLRFSGGPVYNSAGGCIGAAVLFRDVTDARAARNNPGIRGESSFALLACHDLRTPLASIALLANSSQDMEEEQVREYFMEGGRIAEKALEMVDDIFDIAVLKRNAPPPRKVFDLKEVIDSVLRLCLPLARYKGIRLVAEATDARVAGEPLHIARVIQNLTTNAIKFTAAGGRVELRVQRRGADLRIAVIDDGTGMDRNQIVQIFAGNAKARRAGTAGEGSRGYGLLLVGQILEGHGSLLRVRSRPGRGSCFFFRLRSV